MYTCRELCGGTVQVPMKINSYCRHAGLMNEYVKYISDIKFGMWTYIVSKCSFPGGNCFLFVVLVRIVLCQIVVKLSVVG